MRVLEGKSSQYYIHVISSPFSGSTLLGRLLGAQTGFVTLGEVYRNYPRYKFGICSCTAQLDQCDFWNALHAYITELSGRVWSFNSRLDPEFFRYRHLNQMLLSTWSKPWLERINDGFLSMWKNYFEKISHNHDDFFNGVFEFTRTRYFVDTSKRIRLLKHFPLFHETRNLRIVYLIRDPRGVIASYKRRQKKYGYDMDQWIDAWIDTQKNIKHYLSKLYSEESVFQVKYDDLVTKPAGVIEKMFQWLDTGTPIIEPESNVLYKGEIHMVGKPMRLSPIQSLRLDERWKTELDVTEVKRIQEKIITSDTYQFND